MKGIAKRVRPILNKNLLLVPILAPVELKPSNRVKYSKDFTGLGNFHEFILLVSYRTIFFTI